MSVKDELTKDFMSQNSVFAEFINYSIHNGEELIEPENLQELDSVHITSLLNKMEETGDITPKTVKEPEISLKVTAIIRMSSLALKIKQISITPCRLEIFCMIHCTIFIRLMK